MKKNVSSLYVMISGLYAEDCVFTTKQLMENSAK